MKEQCRKLFVYGTLRRGQKYRYLIEAYVVKEQAATVRGEMYEYAAAPGQPGGYPYLIPGDDVVHGEVLTFGDFETALKITDDIEECPILYIRRLVELSFPDGSTGQAHGYFIQPGRERPGRRITGGDWLHR